MKLVIVSDLHADWTTYGVSRYSDVEIVALAAVAHAVREKADAFFFLGDLCDPDDVPAVLKALGLALRMERQLTRAGIPSYWLAGNHDSIEDGSGRTTLSPLREVQEYARGATILESPGTYVRGMQGAGLAIVSLPYTSSSHGYDSGKVVREAEETLGKVSAPSENIVVLSHLAMEGVQSGEETTEMPRGREVVFPVEDVHNLRRLNPRRLIVLQGHYHRAQSLWLMGDLEVHIPGSAVRLTFGEEGNTPGYLTVEL